MDYPLVSIVTLTYKKFDYIYSTIKSVLNQDYPNIEYIVADDGSNNFPKEDIESFIKKNSKANLKRFIIIDNKENIGTVKNINRAYKIATGEYIMPLSADDEFLHKNIVSKIISEFDRRKCDVLITSRLVCDKDLTPLFYLPHLKERAKIDKLDTCEKQYIAMVTYELYEVMSGSVLYMKKKKIEQFGYFDENYRLLEDAPFIEKYLRNEKINIAYDIVSIKYRVGGVSYDKVNTILIEDFNKYNRSVLERSYDLKNAKLKRRLEYTNSFINNSSIWGRIICYLRKPDIFVKRFFYRIERELCKKYDIKYIENKSNKGINNTII